MIENLEQRIGEYHIEDGHKAGVKTHPQFDVQGNRYTRPAGNLAQLDKARFVVLPSGFRNWPLLDEIKAQLGIGVPAAKAKGKQEPDRE